MSKQIRQKREERELKCRLPTEAPEWQEGQPHFCDPMFDDKSVAHPHITTSLLITCVVF